MKIIITLLVLLIGALDSIAADYYVSVKASAALNEIDEGATSWGNATSIESPTSIGTAMARAAAGDNVLIRGGTYYIQFPTSPSYETSVLSPSNSGTSGSPIKFIAYTGEIPIFDCIGMDTWQGGQSNYDDYQCCRVIGSQGKNYITFDGLKLITMGGERVAEMNLFGSGTGVENYSSGIVIRNMDISGGTHDTETDSNSQLIRLENLNAPIVEYNYLHDNQDVDLEEDDSCAIKNYHTLNAIIRNNKIVDCTNGLHMKSLADGADIYNNFIYNIYRGISFTTAFGMTSDDVHVHNNIIAKFRRAALGGDYSESTYPMSGYEINNNTFYSLESSNDSGLLNPHISDGFKIYNNIIAVSDYTIAYMRSRYLTYMAECDHNQWGNLGTFKIITNYGAGDVTDNSLVDWQASGVLAANYDAGCGSNQNPGCGSLTSDPVFVTATGDRDTVAEFALDTGSPCLSSGRSGANIGADWTQVGIGSSESHGINGGGGGVVSGGGGGIAVGG